MTELRNDRLTGNAKESPPAVDAGNGAPDGAVGNGAAAGGVGTAGPAGEAGTADGSGNGAPDTPAGRGAPDEAAGDAGAAQQGRSGAAPVSVVWALVAAATTELVVGFWPSRAGPDFDVRFWLLVVVALLTAIVVAVPSRARPLAVGFAGGLSMTAVVLPLSMVGARIDGGIDGSISGLVLDLAPIVAWAAVGVAALLAVVRLPRPQGDRVRSPVAFHASIGGAILASAALVVRPSWFGVPAVIGPAEIILSAVTIVALPVITGVAARRATALRSAWLVGVAVEIFLFLGRWESQLPWEGLPRPWNGVASVALFGGVGLILSSALVLYLATGRRRHRAGYPATAGAAPVPSVST